MRQEFRLRNIKLDYPDPTAFSSSPWFPPLIFVIYRTIIALYVTTWSILGGILRLDQGALWFIFLTNWSYTVLNLHFIIGALLPAYHYYTHSFRNTKVLASDQNANNEEPANGDVQLELHNPCAVETKAESPIQHSRMFVFACKASWVVFNIAANIAPLVSVMYWGFTYVPGEAVDSSNANAHAVNSVLMLADVMISNIPVRLFHVVYPIAYGAIYVTFTVIYWAAGGVNHRGQTYIYGVLDYGGSPGLAASLAVMFVLVAQPISQFLLYGLVTFREWLMGRRNTVDK